MQLTPNEIWSAIETNFEELKLSKSDHGLKYLGICLSELRTNYKHDCNNARNEAMNLEAVIDQFSSRIQHLCEQLHEKDSLIDKLVVRSSNLLQELEVTKIQLEEKDRLLTEGWLNKVENQVEEEKAEECENALNEVIDQLGRHMDELLNTEMENLGWYQDKGSYFTCLQAELNHSKTQASLLSSCDGDETWETGDEETEDEETRGGEVGDQEEEESILEGVLYAEECLAQSLVTVEERELYIAQLEEENAYLEERLKRLEGPRRQRSL